MALVCEKVLREADGVLTPVRVIDRIIRQAQGIDVPEVMPPFDQQVVMIIALKAGGARGRSTVAFDMEMPNGQRKPGRQYNAVFEAEDRGHNIVTDMSLRLELEGLYWFDVTVDGQVVTRIPLRVVYDPRPVHPEV
jgi:hypothetical protein